MQSGKHHPRNESVMSSTLSRLTEVAGCLQLQRCVSTQKLREFDPNGAGPSDRSVADGFSEGAGAETVIRPAVGAGSLQGIGATCDSRTSSIVALRMKAKRYAETIRRILP